MAKTSAQNTLITVFEFEKGGKVCYNDSHKKVKFSLFYYKIKRGDKLEDSAGGRRTNIS